MKYILVVLVLTMLCGCSGPSENDKNEAIKFMYDNCASKISMTIEFNGFGNVVSFTCEDFTPIIDEGV